jgi:hypothetical protein
MGNWKKTLEQMKGGRSDANIRYEDVRDIINQCGR